MGVSSRKRLGITMWIPVSITKNEVLTLYDKALFDLCRWTIEEEPEAFAQAQIGKWYWESVLKDNNKWQLL